MSTSRGRQSWWWVAVGLFAVQASQLVLFAPGTDVSPWAWAQGMLQPFTIAGITVQTWALGALALIIVTGISLAFAAGRTPGSASLTMMAGSTAVLLAYTLALGSLTANAFFDAFGKLLLPIILFFYLVMHEDERTKTCALVLVMASNIFTIGQVFLCAVVTGSFSAHRYYIQLPAEFFGFYYHPFAFSGVLMVCAIVALRNIGAGWHRRLNVGLFAVDLAFIGLAQVRTFELALALGLLVVIWMSLRRAGHGGAGILFTVVAVGVACVYLSDSITAGARLADDVTSGRLERWRADLQSFYGSASLGDLLFGRGPLGITDLNVRLFNLPINSLNVFVDNLVNIGVLGSLAYVVTWIAVLGSRARKSELPYLIGLTAAMLMAAVVTNVFEFPVVTTIFVISLFSVSEEPLRWRQNAHSRSVFAAVP